MISTILKGVMIGTDVLFLLVILFTLLSAWKKGTGKFLYKSAIKWIIILVYIIFFSRMVAEALLEIPFIREFVDNNISSNIASALKLSIEEYGSSEIGALVNAFTISIVNIVAAIVGVLLIHILVYPIIKLFLSIFKLKKLMYDKKIKASKSSKIIALFIGLLVVFIKFSVIFSPIYALSTSYNKVYNSYLDIVEVGEVSEDSMPQQIYDGFQFSVVTKFLSLFDYNISQQYVDHVIQIETEHGSLKLIKEANNVLNLIPMANDLSKGLENGKEKFEIDLSPLKKLINESEFLNVFLPVTADYVSRMDEVRTLNISFPEDIDWEKEVDAIKSFSTSSIQVTESIANMGLDSYILSDKCSEELTNMFSKVRELRLFMSFIPFVQNELDKAAQEGEGFVSLVRFIDIEAILTTDLPNLVPVITNAYRTFIIEEFNVYNLSDNQINALSDVLESIFKLSFFSNHSDEILTELCKSFAGDAFDETKYSFEGINWDNEPEKISNIFKAVAKIIRDVIPQEGEEIDYVEALSEANVESRDDLIEALKASDLVNKVLFPILDEKVKTSLVEAGFESLSDKISFTTMTADELKSDFSHVFGIIQGLDDLRGEDDSFNFKDAELTKKFLHHIFDLSFVSGSESDFIEFALKYSGMKESLDEMGIIVNTDVSNWDSEIDNLAQFLTDFVTLSESNIELGNFTESINDENKAQFLKVLKDILHLELFQQSIPSLINMGIESGGLSEWKSEWFEEQLVEFKASEWDSEIDNLVELLVLVNGNDIDFADFSDPAGLNAILHKLVRVKTLSKTPIIDKMNEKLQELSGEEKDYIDPTHEFTIEQWDSDIDKLFAEDGLFVKLQDMGSTEVDMFKVYGGLIDDLRATNLFAEAIDNFVDDYMNKMMGDKLPQEFSNGLSEIVSSSMATIQNRIDTEEYDWSQELENMDSFVGAAEDWIALVNDSSSDVEKRAQASYLSVIAEESVIASAVLEQYLKDHPEMEKYFAK